MVYTVTSAYNLQSNPHYNTTMITLISLPQFFFILVQPGITPCAASGTRATARHLPVAGSATDCISNTLNYNFDQQYRYHSSESREEDPLLHERTVLDCLVPFRTLE